MSKVKEILNKLTPSQKVELEKDISAMVKNVAKEYKGDPGKIAEVNTNCRLQGEVYLNLTIFFRFNEQGEINAVINDIHKFSTVDEYLDAINAAQTPKNGFQKLK